MKIERSKDTVAASKVVVSESTRPCRIVLRKMSDGQYVTHLEILTFVVEEGEPVLKSTGSYSNGHYFTAPYGGVGGRGETEEEGQARYTQAVADFVDRAEKL